jgi:putative transposase
MDLDKNRHSVYKLQYHLVVSTKYRKKVINKDINSELKYIAVNIF